MLTNSTTFSRRASFGVILLVLLFVTPPSLAADKLAEGFHNPPDATKPWCYWYWISDNISKEGITRDLEAMARVGIGEACIGNIFRDEVPAGEVKVLSEEWWSLIEHAIREGARVGVNIGMFNCPGWSQSGGPWIEEHQAMRFLVASETRARGPSRFSQKELPAPADAFQDVSVIAFPAPQADADSLRKLSPKITCRSVGPSAAEEGELAVDGRLETAMVLPKGDAPIQVDIETDEPFTARHLTLTPSESAWSANCELTALGEDGQYHSVRHFRFDRSNMNIHVGPIPRGPVTISFPPVTARRFQLTLINVAGEAALAEIELSGAARLESYIEKQLGKMHPTPLPQWDTYLWPSQQATNDPSLAVSSAKLIDLTSQMTSDGLLEWDVPPGDWVILRIGMTITGTKNSPASPEGEGWEVDKMNLKATRHHFDSFMGEILRRIPADERKALKHVIADSYETGSQNWTNGFAETFRKRYGYDPIRWLPVLTGRIVGSADQSDRFLWDLRRLVADHVAKDYVGGMREQCHENGLQLWLENYGHWGYPAEFLQYGGQSDFVAGEFWTQGSLGSIECRAASSCANIYGKPFVSAESYTSTPSHFNTMPADLKARGDWSFCEGINHVVLHVYIQQPWEDRLPGVNTWFGTEFNRHNTWFEESKSWMGYLRRSCYLLQQGTRVVDVAYFIGEDTPKMTGIRNPELPAGHDFDYINAEVLLDRASVKNGRVVLPHGTNYRILVIPEQESMRPEVLQKLYDLIEAGATIVGRPPQRSPSLENYPRCDAIVKRLAEEMWGAEAAQASGERQLGEGQLIWGKDLNAVFGRLGVTPDFHSQVPLSYTHRSVDGKDIYFVTNPQDKEVATLATFRAGNRAPELWSAVTGEIVRPAVYDQSGPHVRLPITLGPHGSVFVVFGDEPAAAERLVEVSREGETISGTRLTSSQSPHQSVQLSLTESGKVMGHFWQSGNYSFKNADGQIKTIEIGNVPAPITVGGPWQVTFKAPYAGGPEPTTFDKLSDCSKHEDESIRYFAGKATYQTTFSLSETPDDGKQIRLDLGDVGGMATVRLNGQNLGTLWIKPWQTDISDAVRAGENRLEVEVVIPWYNRLVGDSPLKPEERHSYLSMETDLTDSPLKPAGLLSEVTIHIAQPVEVK